MGNNTHMGEEAISWKKDTLKGKRAFLNYTPAGELKTVEFTVLELFSCFPNFLNVFLGLRTLWSSYGKDSSPPVN